MLIVRRLRFAAVLTALLAWASPSGVLAQSDLQALDRRMSQFLKAGKYAEALMEARKIEAAIRARFGEGHPTYAQALSNVAFLLATRGDYAEAEAVYKSALAVAEKNHGADDLQVAKILNAIAAMYVDQIRYGDADGAMRRALRIVERVLPDSDPFYAKMLNDLAVLSEQQGKYFEAEGLYRRAIDILERVKGPGNVEVARALGNLAVVYHHLGRLDDAARLHIRALPVLEKALGRNHPDVATELGNKAALLRELGRYREDEEALQRALGVREKSFGAQHPQVAQALAELASVYEDQGRKADQEAALRRALAIYEKVHGPNHPDVASILNGLAVAAVLDSRHADAERLLSRAAPIYENNLGADHPKLEGVNSNFAYTLAIQGRYQAALERARAATRALDLRTAAGAQTLRRVGQESRIAEGNTGSYRIHLMALAGLARQKPQLANELGSEGFEIGQGASHSSAAAAVQQMANRFAAGGGRLAGLIRVQEEFLSLKREVDKALIAEMGKPGRQSDRPVYERMRRQLDEKIAENAAFIEGEFPDYADLTNPRPLKLEHAQKLLAGDEALVFFQLGYTEAYVFAVTRDRFRWAAIPLDPTQIAEKVKAFRHGLDVEEAPRALELKAQDQLFNIHGAHELYLTLFGPVDETIRDKHHLLIVPSGIFTALPFHLLVTDKPLRPSPNGGTDEVLAAYRQAAWLLKRHAVTVLPSVTSLKALRVFARKGQAPKPMIGFGDPVFDAAKEGAPKQPRAAVKTRAYTEFWRGAGVDRARLAQDLVRLPDTADELKAVAASLGADAADIYLRAAASETTLKSTALSAYRIIYFATHGLVAGDVKGLAEPSLALTLPPKPTDQDDGLLTASEIAQLKLNADWVVLSACNTMAGDKPGAEALSGLARAFFYAGARALLVTHWLSRPTPRRGLRHRCSISSRRNPSLRGPKRSGAPRSSTWLTVPTRSMPIRLFGLPSPLLATGYD